MRNSISGAADRHSVVDRRPGQYLCFPDVAREPDGGLLAVYREADQHVAQRSRLLFSRSADGGRTWGAPQVLNGSAGHCPRVSCLETGERVVIDDLSASLYRFGADGGFQRIAVRSSAWHELFDTPLSIPDRILTHSDGRLSSIAQVRLGTRPASRYPTTGQAQWANLYYESADGGETWVPLSVVGMEKDLSLCETSACRLPDGRLLALMRENTGVYEPMYAAFSGDDGKSWGPVRPTPLIGHRPCMGTASSGKLLVTYRGVGPERATNAWLGDAEELCEFAVHGSDGDVSLSPEGLRITGGGRHPVFYALRPLSNPVTASAELEFRVEALDGRDGMGIQFGGVWWVLSPGGVCPELDGCPAQPVPPGSVLRLCYAAGETVLLVNGAQRLRIPVKPDKAARPITFGERASAAGGASLWKQLSLRIREPSYLRDYEWSWKPVDGLPDAYTRERVLELKNAAGIWGGDYGYSGWTETAPGAFCCVYHHADPDAERMRGSYLLTTRFTADDFKGR